MYLRRLILVKVAPLVTKMNSVSFRVIICYLLLTPKSNQHIYEPKYLYDQSWVKFLLLLLLFEIWCSQDFRVIACCDPDL